MKFVAPAKATEIAEEVALLTGLTQSEAERRLLQEIDQWGTNVCNDLTRFDVTPHVYNENMQRLYEKGDGFIFETLVFWQTPQRQQWTKDALRRINKYLQSHNCMVNNLRILMLGDGTGSDSLLLAENGFHVDYFDFPNSKTFQFTKKRFEHYQVLNSTIKLITDYEQIQKNSYDIVMCFEVLEHLPDPVSSISDIAEFMKQGAIALITEAFPNVSPKLPTHLYSNRQFDGKTPFLFHRHGLSMTWHSHLTLFKPTEYTKNADLGAQNFMRLLFNFHVLKRFIGGRLRNLKAKMKN